MFFSVWILLLCKKYITHVQIFWIFRFKKDIKSDSQSQTGMIHLHCSRLWIALLYSAMCLI